MTALAATLLYMHVVWVTPALEPVYAVHFREATHGAELRALEQAEQLELAAAAAGVPLELLTAVREDESHFDDGLVGDAGELGGMQLLPGTPWWQGWIRSPGCIPRARLSAADLVGSQSCESANVLWGAYALRDALDACGGDQHAAMGFYRTGRCVAGPRGAATLELAEWLRWRLSEVAMQESFPDWFVSASSPLTCRKCNRPEGEVPFYETTNLRAQRVCRPCHREAAKEYARAKPHILRARAERVKQQPEKVRRREARRERRRALEEVGGYWHRDYAKLMPGHLLGLARKRALREGVPFAITVADVVVPDRCPILGIELKKHSGRQTEASATLDRVVPALGYVPGNVAVISGLANRLKQDGSAEDHERIAAYIRRHDPRV